MFLVGLTLRQGDVRLWRTSLQFDAEYRVQNSRRSDVISAKTVGRTFTQTSRTIHQISEKRGYMLEHPSMKWYRYHCYGKR